jgi:hypothetical protein
VKSIDDMIEDAMKAVGLAWGPRDSDDVRVNVRCLRDALRDLAGACEALFPKCGQVQP